MVFYEYKVFGVVQGVGFRPHIYKLAMKNSFFGSVRNEDGFVRIIVNDEFFEEKIRINPPLLARIDKVTKKKTSKKSFVSFSILDSIKKTRFSSLNIPTDLFLCFDCKKDLDDSHNRRHNYYFVTCTNCGPRYTIIENTPYDRVNTSMKSFEMCDDCKKEYINPEDRRYHAQTIACKTCGPRLSFTDKETNEVFGEVDAIRKAVEALRNDELVSVKGVGGFHIVSTTTKKAVLRLRRFIQRENKPLALMAKNTQQIKKVCVITSKEEEHLLSPQRPILILEKKELKTFDYVSELSSLGFMLPYTALHELILKEFDEPLIFTSNNFADEPIEHEVGLTNKVLSHQRRIVNKVDDSIIKVIKNKAFFLRRARGYTPTITDLGDGFEDCVCLGAEMNSSFTILKDGVAYTSQFLGNTTNHEAFDNYKEELNKWISWIKPEIKKVVCDAHPEYNTTKHAEKLAKDYKAELVKVLHHKAHLASIILEKDLKCDSYSISFDGLGFGEDQEVWGGEVFKYTHKNKEFIRVAHLEAQKLIGGDSAARNPKKYLFGILKKFMSTEKIKRLGLYSEDETLLLSKALEQDFNTHNTTSTGRVLDAAAVLLGFCDVNSYDARCAMILESKAYKKPLFLEPVIRKENNMLVLETTPLFEFLTKNLDNDKGVLASTVHEYLANGYIKIINALNNESFPVLVSGGVTYNKHITKKFLEEAYITNQKVPSGDGGISLGQAHWARKK
ncbi:carbamoyltransferase HypF [Candidatus Woesearchaeota archaeon]|nr:carbamoyltransferase HypF [Candidatus Woesearchaeota archaeon]